MDQQREQFGAAPLTPANLPVESGKPGVSRVNRVQRLMRGMFAGAAIALVADAAAGCSGARFDIAISDEDAGTEGGVDGMTDTMMESDSDDAGKDASTKDVGPDGDAALADSFSNDAKKNVCIKWMTAELGVQKGASADDHNCEPKPYSFSMPLGKSYDLYIWSKDVPTNNAVAFTSGYTFNAYKTKCSAYSVPPKNSEMNAELVSAGYSSTVNAGTAPNVELNNASCANGVAFVAHVAP